MSDGLTFLSLVALLLCSGPVTSAESPTVLAGPADWTNWKPQGDWAWAGDWVGGTGTDQWRWAEAGEPTWDNLQVSFRLRISKASTREGAKWEAGNWTWASYRNNANAPDYEAGLAVRKQGEEMYRVMFSLRGQEVALWSSRGGFLRVVPFQFEADKVYQAVVQADGPYLRLTLDGQPLFEYLERHGVLTAGGVAVGLHEGEAAFSAVTVAAMPAASRPVPSPHRPNLRFRDWKGARWAWDGDEPIFLAGNDCNGYEMKLVPGWRPQLYGWWHWCNYGDEYFYADKLTDFQVLEQGERLRFVVTGTDTAGKTWLISRAEVTVTYDSVKNVYVHDTVSDLIIPEGHSLKFNHPVEFTDPFIYGHVGSASPHASWEVPHPWSIYRHESGRLYKLPHNHVYWYPGFREAGRSEARANYLAPDGFWAVVGDPVANPVLSIIGSSVPTSQFHSELCHWAHDVHMRWFPVKYGQTLNPGTYTVKWRLTSVDGKQAEEWLQQADICGVSDPDASLLLYTAGIGERETFDKVVKWASPFSPYPWSSLLDWYDLRQGNLQDPTVGREDHTSLRLQGPRSAVSMTGASVYNDRVLPNTDYEVSAWVKAEGVQGEGPGLTFGGQDYYPRITGTQDWQRIGFVCRPDEPLHTVILGMLNSGSGTVWFDDFMVRPLRPGETPPAPIAAAPQPLPGPPDGGGALLVWDSRSDVGDPGRTLLDQSGYGGHGRLEGSAQFVEQEGKRVVEFDGGAGYVTTDRPYLFPSPQSLALWVKPAPFPGDASMIATGGVWKRGWRLSLSGKQPPYNLEFTAVGRRLSAPAAVPADQWSHIGVVDDGRTVTLYVNGAAVKSEAVGGPAWTVGVGAFLLGTWLSASKPTSSFRGRLGGISYWNQALSAEQVQAQAARGLS